MNRNYELSRKITKIVINILQKNSDNERYFQNAWKQAIFEILRMHYSKFQIPVVKGLKMNLRIETGKEADSEILGGRKRNRL